MWFLLMMMDSVLDPDHFAKFWINMEFPSGDNKDHGDNLFSMIDNKLDGVGPIDNRPSTAPPLSNFFL